MDNNNSILGFIFDLDGTLVNSGLDFDAMRREMGLAPGASILESLKHMNNARKIHCCQILEQHELEGAKRAALLPGVSQFLEHLRSLNLHQAIVTRNSRLMTLKMLTQCSLHIDTVITRDDGPTKPDPWAIHQLCKLWKIQPENTVVIGDFKYDIEAGRQAGAKTVFFTRDRSPENLDGIDKANYLLESFVAADELLLKLGLPATSIKG